MTRLRLLALLAALAALVFGPTWLRTAATGSGGSVRIAAADTPARAGDDSTVDAAAPTDERCAALRAEGLRVALADPAETAWCLVETQDADTHYIQLLNVPDPGAFAARKAQTARALEGADVDLCGVTLWWVRRDAVRAGVPAPDQYAAPRACPPRIVAHDPLAQRWADFTSRTVAEALTQAERDYGLHPSLPLTIHLHGARAAYAARVAGQGSPDAGARLAESEGIAARDTIAGAWIALDTSRFSATWPEQAAFTIRHEIAHYLQTAVAGCACVFPVWFAEGMAEYTAASATGPISPRHLAARAAEREGRALPLRALDSYPAGDGIASVYDRGYAAAAYLAERWGPDALGELLHRTTDPASFNRALTAVTGLSLDEFDRTLGRWLAGGLPEGAATGRMVLRYVTAAAAYEPKTGRIAGEGSVFPLSAGQVDVVAMWDSSPGAHQVITRWYRPDGTLFLEETVAGADLRGPLTTRSHLGFTTPGRAGGRPTDTPGRWRVEITADSRLVATLDIVIGR